jgi:poly(A) polymerase
VVRDYFFQSLTFLVNVSGRAGTVESRIRQLVMKLEYVDSLTLAHPFVKGFDQISYCLNEEEVHAIAQGEIPEGIAGRKKEDIEGKEGAYPVYTTTFYIGLAIEPKQGRWYFLSNWKTKLMIA